MIRALALLPLIGLTAILLAWASAPAVDAMAPAVGQGVGDAARAIGIGCAVALVVLAGFGGLIGLLIAGATRRDRPPVRYIDVTPAPPALPSSQAIEPSWYTVKESEYVE